MPKCSNCGGTGHNKRTCKHSCTIERNNRTTDTMTDIDIVTFTERLMDDAASDIHQLIDEVTTIKKTLKLKEHHLEQASETVALLIKTFTGEMDNGGLCDFVNVGDEYTLSIPSEVLVKTIVECGIKAGVFAKGRYSYTRCNCYRYMGLDSPEVEGVHIILEELE